MAAKLPQGGGLARARPFGLGQILTLPADDFGKLVSLFLKLIGQLAKAGRDRGADVNARPRPSDIDGSDNSNYRRG
ncbi:hypothetical protein PYR71_15765 [Rhizobium sp. MC63]|nr:hypothetical protein [Rhizobium sp. MC63]